MNQDATVHSQRDATVHSQRDAAVIIQRLEHLIQDGAFAGASVIAAKKNQIVFEHYAGKAAPNLNSNKDTLWPIASISKLYCVAAIMRLVELGELNVAMPVHHVLPKFIGDMRELMRLRHLLTHTSGLIYESVEMEERLKAHTPIENIIEEAYSAPLQFAPGTQFSYADYNTLLAGHMAEVATGKSISVLVQELVLSPMRLENTFFPAPPETHARIAEVRSVMAAGTSGAMYNSAHARQLPHPAFAVVATAQDLIKFALHFAPGGPRIHAEATVRAMTRDQTGGTPGFHPTMKGFVTDLRVPWGFGFSKQTSSMPALFSELASPETFGHGGASGCQLVIDPAQDLTMAILSNTHVREGRELWYSRLQSVINPVFASFATPV